MISALQPIFASLWAEVPPEFDSLMVPVSGLLAPAEIRPELEAAVPESKPGAKTSLFLGPKAWQVGGTSAATILDVSPRPPWPAQFSGTSSMDVERSVMFTRKILSAMVSPC